MGRAISAMLVGFICPSSPQVEITVATQYSDTEYCCTTEPVLPRSRVCSPTKKSNLPVHALSEQGKPCCAGPWGFQGGVQGEVRHRKNALKRKIALAPTMALQSFGGEAGGVTWRAGRRGAPSRAC